MQTDLMPEECPPGLGGEDPDVIIAVPSIYDDINLGSTALRAIANLLADNEHDEEAIQYY